jgi:hypothetical protein
MINFFKKIIFFIIISSVIFSSISCRKEFIRESYMLSDFLEIQQIEKKNHQFCESLDLDSAKFNKNFSNDIYWICRSAAAKEYQIENISQNSDQKISRNIFSPDFQNKLADLIAKIDVKIINSSESNFNRYFKRLDKKDHEKCLKFGYKFDVNDRLQIDQYLLCRERLIENDQLDTAFGESSYLKYPNRTYSLGFVVNKRLDDENKKFLEIKEKYLDCLIYFDDEKQLNLCIKAKEDEKKCFSQITKKKFLKEAEEKISCQRLAYVRFPDEMLIKDEKESQEIIRAKKNADAFNSNSIASLGISELDLELFEPIENIIAREEEDKKNKKNKISEINSFKSLYKKNELVRLRRDFIHACQSEADKKIVEYLNFLNQECEEIGDYKISTLKNETQTE